MGGEVIDQFIERKGNPKVFGEKKTISALVVDLQRKGDWDKPKRIHPTGRQKFHGI